MSKRNKFYEPWVAKAATSSLVWTSPPQAPEWYDDSEKRQWDSDWNIKLIKTMRDRPWHCLGSNMSPPSISWTITGKPVVIDDQQIMLEVTKHGSWPEGSPTHAEVAQRVAACVTAMTGIDSPIGFMEQLRSIVAACEKTSEVRDRQLWRHLKDLVQECD